MVSNNVSHLGSWWFLRAFEMNKNTRKYVGNDILFEIQGYGNVGDVQSRYKEIAHGRAESRAFAHE